MNIDDLRLKIISANQAYRAGNAQITDAEYDELLDELSVYTNGQDELLQKIGFEIPTEDSRKEPLPIPMYSMHKIKTIEELQKWAELNFITSDTKVVVTPKYDGLSFCAEETTGDAWTRGNGTEGQRSNEHYRKMMQNKNAVSISKSGYSLGEIIMSKQTFGQKWSEEFKNSRNMGAGALNRKETTDMLKDFDFLRYSFTQKKGDLLNKTAQIDFCNKYLNTVQVPYQCVPIKDVTEAWLKEIFEAYSQEYETDGLIIEIDDLSLRKQLGRETNGNPLYARAWKGFGSMERISEIQGIDYQISKFGLLKPVARIAPIELDGVTVSNVTLNNARFVASLGLGVGAKVNVIRSGQVIPKIVGVVQEATVELPETCPSCGEKVAFNANEIELICKNSEGCKAQKLQKMIAFFSILEVENLAEATIEQLYDNGYDSIAKIMALEPADFVKLESFQQRKSEKIYNAIREKTQNVSLEKLQHATSIFEGLGSKKLALLRHYNKKDMAVSLEEILKIDGFSDTSAQIFIKNYAQFWAFIKDLPITIAETVITQNESEALAAISVCFSGFRDAELEVEVTKNGGKILGSVSKNTTHLVMKEVGTGSTKEKSAQKLGVVVMQKADFEAYITELLA